MPERIKEKPTTKTKDWGLPQEEVKSRRTKLKKKKFKKRQKENVRVAIARNKILKMDQQFMATVGR